MSRINITPRTEAAMTAAAFTRLRRQAFSAAVRQWGPMWLRPRPRKRRPEASYARGRLARSGGQLLLRTHHLAAAAKPLGLGGSPFGYSGGPPAVPAPSRVPPVPAPSRPPPVPPVPLAAPGTPPECLVRPSPRTPPNSPRQRSAGPCRNKMGGLGSFAPDASEASGSVQMDADGALEADI